MYAEIVFNRPIPPYTYRIPENMNNIQVGMRVEVDLSSSLTTGIVYRITDKCNLEDIKPIKQVIDKSPVLNDDLIMVAEWISQYYVCSLGEACWAIIPKGVKKRDVKVKHDGYSTSSEDIVELTEEQSHVLDELNRAVEKSELSTYLLHGVTGSGKTEVYLRVIKRVIEMGKGAILLVPEIALTPQTVRYFEKRFGNTLAVLHSRLTKAERINEWYRIINGEKKIVIGARSAIFAPLERIGIIIIDEEHETSYKSDDTPRYNARSVAYYRAKMHNSVLILGSATPSIESYYLAKSKKFKLLELTTRVLNQNLPKTKITDLRKVRGRKFISNQLYRAIETRLRNNEQVILFLNRRGYSPFVFCETCGYVMKCKNCDISMTYHRNKKKLICHYCGYTVDPPELCPNCSSEKISFSGFGTERIEDLLNDLFPGAVIVRMDTDTLIKRKSLPEILNAFAKRQIDILIGTQIVTKGLHFPNVTLVGVLNADIALNFPDFRAAERTFDLITQVAGRAGRGEKGGEVIIQTYNPSHYAIQTAKSHDYLTFFMQEIKYRQALNYPPFCRIVRLVFRGKKQKKLFETAYIAIDIIKEKAKNKVAILGPSVCPLSRIKQNYRVHVIIKTDGIAGINSVLFELNSKVKRVSGVYMEIDIDPISML